MYPPIITIGRLNFRTYASEFKKVYDAVYDPRNKDVKCPLFVALLIQHFKGQDVSLINGSDQIYSEYHHEAIQYTIDRTGEFVEKDRFWNMSTNKIQEITKLPLVRLMYPVIYPVSLLFL